MSTPSTPILAELRVVPVAGRDSMLLNLSGAHGPYFTRNVVILRDSLIPGWRFDHKQPGLVR